MGPLHFTLTRAENGATQYVSGQQTYRMLSDRGPNLVLEWRTGSSTTPTR